MPQKLIEAPPHPYLTYAQVQNTTTEKLRPFLEACDSNDAAFALQLVPNRDAGALSFGLNRALGGGHLDLARQLLRVGAKWDTQTVILASKSLDAVKLLREFGFDVNSGLVEGSVLLPMVVRHNDEPYIRYLLEQGAKPKLGPPLIKQGPGYQIRPISKSGSALNAAAAHCTPEIFALLLSHGADISYAMPLHCAAGTAHRTHPDSRTRYNIPSGDRIPMLEYLVGLGLDVNASDDAIKIADDGRGQHGTPLQYADMWGRVEEAKWLLSKGADPDKKTPYGISARDRAKRLPPKHELAILLQTAATS